MAGVVPHAADVPVGAIEELCGPLDAVARERLERYARLVRESARKLSLISRKAEGEIGAHLVDSAALLAALSLEGVSLEGGLADLGSGAGFPGVVVAVIRPQVKVIAVDSRNARVVFLKQVQRALELPNLEVVHDRVERVAVGRRFELATSRALGAIGETLGASLGTLSDQGRLVLFKGPRWADEQQAAVAIAEGCGCGLGWVRSVELPGLGRSTTFVEFHVEHGGPRSGLAPRGGVARET